MKTIWKYPIGLATTHEIPRGAKILDIQIQGAHICAWILLDPSAPLEARKFYTIGTGGKVPPDLEHLGTVQCGDFVWHVFEDARG